MNSAQGLTELLFSKICKSGVDTPDYRACGVGITPAMHLATILQYPFSLHILNKEFISLADIFFARNRISQS